MKHNLKTLEKAIMEEKGHIEIHSEILLLIEELQQLNKQRKEIDLCQNCPIIDEILGENQ